MTAYAFSPHTTRPTWGIVFSLIGHTLLAALVFLGFSTPKFVEPPPVAVELWSAPVSQPEQMPPSPTPTPAPKITPRPAPKPPVIAAAKPDIALKKAPEPPTPLKKLHPTEPQKIPEKPTPQKKTPPPPEKPQKPQKTDKKPPEKPQKPTTDAKRSAKKTTSLADDLLADLDGLPSPSARTPNATRTQAGAKTGQEHGAQHGKTIQGYASLVVQRIKPRVQIPDDLTGNPKAILEVTLLPSLEVRTVKIVQSSGHPAYDNAVERAVWAAKSFPALLPHMQFSDVRRIRLEFRPH